MKTLYKKTDEPKTRLGTMQRISDGSGIKVGRKMDLSTPIVSSQDGPRMSGKISNFGGKKAAPFRKGKKRRAAKRALAKALLKK